MSSFEDATPEERAWFMQRFHDYPWYAEHAPLMVQDKETSSPVPMVFRPAQKYVTARQWQQARSGRPVRSLIPKFRQGGITTLGLGKFVHIGQTRADRMMMLMLHDLKLSTPMHQRLRGMVDNIGKHLPEGAPRLPKSAIRKDKEGSELGFASGSLIQIETAGKHRGIGRGNTIHHVWATEIPSWPDPDKTMTGIIDAVPELPMFESSITLESTSEGVGDWWYWACMKAAQGRGDFDLIFLPWWMELVYGARDPMADDLKHAWKPGGDRRLADCLKEPLAPSEEDLGKRILEEAPSYGIVFLTPDMVVQKLLWRRRKIETGDAEKFMQEYPATLEESFRGTGRPVFTAASVAFHRARMQDGSDEPMIVPAAQRARILQVDTLVDGETVRPIYDLVEDKEGPLHVWKGCEQGEKYIIGGDPSTGEGDDPSAIQVLLNRPQRLEQVAVWHGWCGMVELAYITAWLARAYGNALIVPEWTGLGSEYVNKLVQLRWPGRRLYQRRVLSSKEPGKMVDRPGFDMQEGTRQGVIEQMYDLLKTEVPIIRHAETLQEIEQFQMRKTSQTGKLRADHPPGGHSDLLMAFGMAAYARHDHAAPTSKPRRSQGMRYESSKPPRVRMPGHAGKSRPR